jgi:hypothetical protein
MKNKDNVQELLESLSPKPLPPGLKKKLLSTAYRKQQRFQIITPVLGKVFFLCCVLVVMAFVFDLMITDSEKRNLTAMMDGSQTSETMIEQDLKEIAEELFKNEYEKSLNQWLIQHYKTQKKSAEFTNYQSIIDILKE